MKNLKEQVEELEISPPQDIDPEDDPFAKRDDGSDSDEAPSEAGINGREHYEEITESKLRKPEQLVLGKQYTGAAVSRKTLFDDEGNTQEEGEEEEDDPFVKVDSGSSVGNGELSPSDSEDVEEVDDVDLEAEAIVDAEVEDSDIDSNEAFGSGDEEKFKSKGFAFRGSGKDLVHGDFSEDGDSAEEGDSDEDGALMWDTEDEAEVDSTGDVEMDDGESESEDESHGISEDDSVSDSSTSLEAAQKPSTDREKLKALLANDAAVVASTLSASANADVQKGRAVKQQYQTFDRFLDARIKLQKGLTATSSISIPTHPDQDVSTAAQSAEAAALKLFSTIESIRHSISSASDTTSKKRKRPSPAIPSTSTSALWTRLSNLEDQTLPYRRTTLNKWSTKTRTANGLSAPRSQLDRTTSQETLTSILDAQIASESTSSNINADTAFYQSILRDLIASRASLSQNTSSDIPLLLPSAPKQHRKGVDPKASKGRKVRYTVHEKLQNFTAEEERGTWIESARREFFASLFGGQGVLDEDVVGVEGEDDEDEAMGDEGVLRLFRS